MSMIETGLDAVENFFGMGGGNGGASEIIAKPVDGIVNAIPSVADMVAGTGAAVSNLPVGVDASLPTAAMEKPSTDGVGLLSDWAVKAIGPVMQSIAGAAMRPHRQNSAPMAAGGHSINANTGGYDQLIKGIGKAAGGDPLQGLSGFKNLL